jgi:4-hydroxy-tetrahydrodipicolinate reductase
MTAGARQGPVRIAIHGTGRMGRSIFEAADERKSLEIAALVGPDQPVWLSRPELTAAWSPDLDSMAAKPDLLIDFTLPDGTRTAAEWCGRHDVPLLSGVTGLDDPIIQALRHTSGTVPVLWSPNLSIGVNLLAELARRAAGVVGREVPVEIEDVHHQWKKDAPSGTALMLGSVIAGRRGGDDSAIAYDSIREGEIIGVHRVSFRLPGESFELVHRAGDRGIYARGALDAGLWLVDQAPGFYSAADWLADR